MTTPVLDLSLARTVAETVADPELPMLTLADLGVLREVTEEGGRLVVTVTPTHLGCPALAAIRVDLHQALTGAGFDEVEIRTALAPAWSTDWISARGRAALARHGIAPPAPAGAATGPAPLTLTSRPAVSCPRCGSPAEQLSAHGPTPCTSLQRCPVCAEPFSAMKPL